jgi:hypothetical protein
MILVLGNFAGAFANINKLLNWSIICKDEDKILFYYANKFAYNEHPLVCPFRNYTDDFPRAFFHKYFEYPEGCNEQSFFGDIRFEMGYPTILKEQLPEFLQDYKDSFVYTNPKVFFDPKLPLIRKFYAEHVAKRLKFTPYMRTFFEDELNMIKMLQAEGKKILAVMIRTTKHFRGGYATQPIFDEIHEIQKDYDYILPLTQVKPFYEKLIESYGSKCIFLARDRMPEDIDWVFNTTDEHFEHEFRMSVADTYLASQCDFIASGASNMFIAALFFNPNVPFRIYKELKNRVSE